VRRKVLNQVDCLNDLLFGSSFSKTWNAVVRQAQPIALKLNTWSSDRFASLGLTCAASVIREQIIKRAPTGCADGSMEMSALFYDDRVRLDFSKWQSSRRQSWPPAFGLQECLLSDHSVKSRLQLCFQQLCKSQICVWRRHLS